MYWINLIGTTIISMISIYGFNCILSNNKLTKVLNPKNLIIYIFLNVLFFLNLIFMNDINKVLLNLFITIFLNLIILFDFDYKKSVYYALVFYILGLIIEFAVVVIMSLFFNFSSEVYNSLELGTLMMSIITSFFYFTIPSFKIVKKSVIHIYEKTSNELKSFLFLIFITLYIILLSYNNFKILKNDTNSLINFGLLIFVFVTSLIIAYNYIYKTKIEDKYNQMMEYVSKYESIINEQGKRNHEINNQLMVLSGYINDKKKLKEYLNSIIEDQRGGQNYRIKQLGFLPDGGLKGLIYYKLSKMEELKIKPFLYVSDNLKKKFGNVETDLSKDITKIFGVFVDNAIDAASKSKEKEIVIDIKIDDDNYLIILISNTYKKGSDMSKIGKKGYSTKGYGHGFGLSLVKDISKKNNKIETICEIEDKEFKQTIMVKLK